MLPQGGSRLAFIHCPRKNNDFQKISKCFDAMVVFQFALGLLELPGVGRGIADPPQYKTTSRRSSSPESLQTTRLHDVPNPLPHISLSKVSFLRGVPTPSTLPQPTQTSQTNQPEHQSPRAWPHHICPPGAGTKVPRENLLHTRVQAWPT